LLRESLILLLSFSSVDKWRIQGGIGVNPFFAWVFKKKSQPSLFSRPYKKIQIQGRIQKFFKGGSGSTSRGEGVNTNFNLEGDPLGPFPSYTTAARISTE